MTASTGDDAVTDPAPAGPASRSDSTALTRLSVALAVLWVVVAGLLAGVVVGFLGWASGHPWPTVVLHVVLAFFGAAIGLGTLVSAVDGLAKRLRS